MTTETPFADVDATPEALRRHLIGYLDAAAAHPEIRRVRAAALAGFAPAPGERLLDAGSGTGEVARQLAAAVGPDGSVTALDFSAETVAVARARHDGSPVEYVQGDVTAIDLPDAGFDGVRSERVLQHLADPQAAIVELARVTRPGGRVCVVDTDWASLIFDGLDETVLGEVMRAAGDAGFPRNPTLGRTVRRRMVRAGLVDVTTTPLTLCFTDPDDAGAVVPLTNPNLPMLSQLLSPQLLRAFHETVAEAARRGEFLVAFTMWITIGRRA